MACIAELLEEPDLQGNARFPIAKPRSAGHGRGTKESAGGVWTQHHRRLLLTRPESSWDHPDFGVHAERRILRGSILTTASSVTHRIDDPSALLNGSSHSPTKLRNPFLTIGNTVRTILLSDWDYSII